MESWRSAAAWQGDPDLCELFITALPVVGASISVLVASGARLTLASSDEVAARIDELQFELGEGPQLATARSGEIVSIPDVSQHGHEQWPMFGAALRELPVGSLFCIPLRLGAVTLGVATLYGAAPRQLTLDQEISALAIASSIAGIAAEQAMHSAAADAANESATTPALRREVHQATGMVLVQLDTTATIAYARLQAYAFAHGRSVEAVAHDVVAGNLKFDDTAE